jgi:hypothetical protein
MFHEGTLYQVFESLEKLLDLEFCLCFRAMFSGQLHIFELGALLT